MISDDQGKAQDNASSEEEQTLPGSARSRLKLPKLFSFDYYQQLFKKQYSSFLERAVRAKFYLGRAFRAFISVVSYKHHRSDSYLAVNEMSDWTSDEIDATMMDPSLLLPVNADDSGHIGENDLSDDDSHAVDLPSIEQELEDIVEHRDSQPFYRYIAEELDVNGHHVERRDLRSSLRDHSLNDLVINGGRQIKAAGTKIIDQLEPIGSVHKQMGVIIKDNKYLKSVVSKFSTPPRDDEAQSMRMLPDSVDVDHRKCLLAPRNQGKCGSCYAFAAIALYEWAYCKATGDQVAFSEQYVIDCGNRNDFGCSSGYTHKVREFVEANGLELRDEYPYCASEQKCLYGSAVPPQSRGSIRIPDEGWDYVHLNSIERKLKEAPIVVNLYVERGVFQEYGGGVDLAKGCLGTKKGMHSLLLVGSGREDGNEYWLMRNSFGKRWGEAGYYKMNKKSGCIIPYSGLVVNFPQKPEIMRTKKKKSSTPSDYDWKQLFV